MHASRVKANTSPEESEQSVEARADSQQKTSRRLADSINSRGRKLKLDRRVDQQDRRADTATEYKGPARRKTIDQRENTKDRRNEG